MESDPKLLQEVSGQPILQKRKMKDVLVCVNLLNRDETTLKQDQALTTTSVATLSGENMSMSVQ